MIQTRFPVKNSNAAILIYNILQCEDAENDADRTVAELISEIDDLNGYVSKGVLESALYCCNMQHEDGKFWHPYNYSFEKFLMKMIPKDYHFDMYYNIIYEKRHGEKARPKED